MPSHRREEDLTDPASASIGAELRPDRENPHFFDNSAHLCILRDDLTDLSYDHHGCFFDLISTL